jgi:ParB family chromosome partitioning protein
MDNTIPPQSGEARQVTGGAAPNADPAHTEYRKFPISEIKTSPYQARRTFEEGPLQNLAQSMKEGGLNQPIGIRLLPDGSAELLFGERRLRAAKLLGWTEIEAKVYPALRDQEAALKGVIENVQREDLSAIEQAQAYERLTEPPFSLTQDQASQMTGNDQGLISKYLSVAKVGGGDPANY